MKETFGALLRAARKKAEKTMDEVGQVVGHTVGYVSDVERGYRQPWSNERIMQIAKFLDTDPYPLLKAAAESRGAFVLPADVTPAGRDAGASLMRVWNDLSDEDFRRLEEIATSRTRLKQGGGN